VLVEAVIAEISAEKTAQLGVQWVVGTNNAVGFSNFDEGNSTLANLIGLAAQVNESGSTALATAAASIPQGLHLGVGDFTKGNPFGALINALAKDADTNVLSTPTVVTLDNEEAEIIVGQNVPFVTGNYTTSTGTSTSTSNNTTSSISNPFQTIQREDVGIKLKVKPQINEGNAVKLEIAQEVSAVVASANAATQGPTTNKRSIKTSVLVENGQILVLGGLIDDSLNQSAQKVPLLGDVPLLGNLFRYRDTTKLKRNLMVFLHPVILRDPAQGTLYTSDKYSYIREQQLAARTREVSLLPDVQTPVLKPQEEVKAQGTILNMQPPVAPVPTPVTSTPPTVAPSVEYGFGDK